MVNNQSYNSQANLGSFVPSTFIWDMQQLQSTNVDPKLKELLVRLYQNVNSMQIVLNTKDTAYYSLQEIINGQLYFPTPGLDSTSSLQPQPRQVFRKTIDFGALPGGALVKTVPHNIEVDNGYSITRIYGAATNSTQTSFIPLPFASPVLNENIKLEATNTSVVITTGIDRSAYTVCYVVLEYLKQA